MEQDHRSGLSCNARMLTDLTRARRHRIAGVRKASPVGTSLDFIRASPALEGLKLICAAIKRMRRAPIYDHLPITRRANRTVMCAKPDLHKHNI